MIAQPRACGSRYPSAAIPAADLPLAIRDRLKALAIRLHADGYAPHAICDAVSRAAADAGYLLSGAAILVRQAVPDLARWNAVEDWRRSLATLPQEMAKWGAMQPPQRQWELLTAEVVRRRERRRRKRRWESRKRPWVASVVRDVLVEDLPEAVALIVTRMDRGQHAK